MLGFHRFVPADEHAQIEQALPASNRNQTRLKRAACVFPMRAVLAEPAPGAEHE
tara:strand:- start:14309 stop:14470 length:162 start_codon:yes stop_codon:yes gene_type:complete